MKYYYLEGLEKKGPYTLAEILSRNLSKETMIYREDKKNWLPLLDFEELNITETIDVDSMTVQIDGTSIEEEKAASNDNDKKIKLPKFTILILLILFSIGISGLVTYFQQKNNYDKINDDINVLFNGKTSISDYYCGENLNGKLYDVIYSPADNIYGTSLNNASVKANGKILAFEPSQGENDKDGYWYEEKLKQWGIFKNLNQYFIKEQYPSGFEALNLWRSSDSFTIIKYYGGDMAYKVPEKTRQKGTNYGYFTTPSYDVPTYRPSVNKCYEEAAKFLTKEDKDSTYIPGSYSKILGFKLGELNNDFYQINQIGDEYFQIGDTLHVIRIDGNKSYVIDSDKITSSTSRGDAYVYNSQWLVWYKSYSNQFDIEPIKWVFLKYFSILNTEIKS
jgi:hypothetical protein